MFTIKLVNSQYKTGTAGKTWDVLETFKVNILNPSTIVNLANSGKCDIVAVYVEGVHCPIFKVYNTKYSKDEFLKAFYAGVDCDGATLLKYGTFE